MLDMRARPQSTDSITVNGVSFTYKDVHTVVDRFYSIVAKDEVLSVPFSSVNDWPHHIDRLTHFWWIRLGGEPYLPYVYNPVAKHFSAGFNETFLARWLGLFHEVLGATLEPEQAELWKAVSERMGYALTMKDEQYRKMMAREQ